MIEKQRLQELIEKGATVYYIKHRNGAYIKPLKLEKDYKAEFIYKNLMLDEKDLYEYEHDAIHAIKYVNMKRDEKLSLPFWSEIESGYLGNGLKKRDLFYKEIRNKSGVFAVYINLSGRYIEIIKLGNSGSPSNEVIFSKPFNEENYTKACRLIKKLFMGE